MRLPALLPDEDYPRLSDDDLGRAIDAVFRGVSIREIAISVDLSVGNLRRNFRSVGVSHA